MAGAEGGDVTTKINLEAGNVAYFGYQDVKDLRCPRCGAAPHPGSLPGWRKFPEDARVSNEPLTVPGLAKQNPVTLAGHVILPLVTWRVKEQAHFVCTNAHACWVETTDAMPTAAPAWRPRGWLREARRRLSNAWDALRGDEDDDW